MSGGGYRAALVHAGVVDALGKLGVPVTNMSSVSGGSIIASYLSRGGAPTAFRDAVADGRFRMTRDLLAFENLVRLPSPVRAPGIDVDLWPFFGHFSRLDVQANLVNRVLLDDGKSQSTTTNKGPALMICMTDLTYGLSVGAIDEGYFLVARHRSDTSSRPRPSSFRRLTDSRTGSLSQVHFREPFLRCKCRLASRLFRNRSSKADTSAICRSYWQTEASGTTLGSRYSRPRTQWRVSNRKQHYRSGGQVSRRHPIGSWT